MIWLIITGKPDKAHPSVVILFVVFKCKLGDWNTMIVICMVKRWCLRSVVFSVFVVCIHTIIWYCYTEKTGSETLKLPSNNLMWFIPFQRLWYFFQLKLLPPYKHEMWSMYCRKNMYNCFRKGSSKCRAGTSS